MSLVRHLTVLGASLSYYKSFRRSRVPCKASIIIPIALAVILRGSAICVC